MNAAPLPTTAQALQLLHQWADWGWLRRLDSALAQEVCALDAQASPALAVAAACVSALEGQGHTAVPLSVLADPLWPWMPQAQAVQERLGTQALPQSATPQDGQPPLARWAQAMQALAQALPTTEAQWFTLLSRSPAVALWQRQAWVRASSSPATAAAQGGPIRPLVCVAPDAHGPGFVALHRHARNERRVAQALHRLAATAHEAPAARVQQVLATLFSPEAAHSDNAQARACAVALRAGLTVVTGGPGTGKTYTAARILAALWALHPQPEALRVALAAPTGKAAARLSQSLAEGLAAMPDGVPPALWQRLPPAQTLHSLLGARPDTHRLRHHAGHPLDVDVLLVDEASMVHLELMAALLDALPPHARLVLLGDRDQLASVEAGSVLGDVCPRNLTESQKTEHSSQSQQAPEAFNPVQRQTVVLQQTRRFGGGIGQLARAVNAGDAAAVERVWAASHADLSRVAPREGTPQALWAMLDDLVRQHWGQGYLALLQRPPASAWNSVAWRKAEQGGPTAPCPGTPAEANRAVQSWTERGAESWTDGWAEWALALLQAWDGFRVLCAVHQGDFGTQALNERVQRVLAQAGCIRPAGEWYAGRPVMVTRNDPALGLSNGDVGLVLPGPVIGSREGASPSSQAPRGAGLKACFAQGGQLRVLPVGRLAHVQTAFAMTVHKSQGSEFGHVALVLPPAASAVVGRELVYTGITRARQHFTLLEAAPGALQAAVQQPTRRYSGLAAWLSAQAESGG